jgi:hypothetical protein
MAADMWKLPIDSVTRLPLGYDDWPQEQRSEYTLQVAALTPPGWEPEVIPPSTD